MRKPLFKRFGLFYLPVSMGGGIIAIITLVLMVHDFLFIDSKSHSVSDTYYRFLPIGGIYFLFYDLIASRTSL